MAGRSGDGNTHKGPRWGNSPAKGSNAKRRYRLFGHLYTIDRVPARWLGMRKDKQKPTSHEVEETLHQHATMSERYWRKMQSEGK
ncbi:MAG TPA: hypothetical protein VEW42_02880 [Candidatus Eisenbacteria bacterium]|nr:hypothetical protein [Candidatus Eisenbacteria bacterium]